jgi:hypothetical protein
MEPLISLSYKNLHWMDSSNVGVCVYGGGGGRRGGGRVVRRGGVNRPEVTEFLVSFFADAGELLPSLLQGGRR